MSTQHVPQPPLWRRFLSLPKTHLGWWSVGLSGVSVILLLIALVIIAVYEYPMSGGSIGADGQDSNNLRLPGPGWLA